MTRMFHYTLLLIGALLAGCATRFADRSTWLADVPKREQIEAAKDGKILIFVSGDACHQGPHWILEDADILAVEQVSGAGDEGVITLEPKYVVIRREVDGRTLELRYDLKRRTRLEKQDIHLKHGDSVIPLHWISGVVTRTQ
jgi:hypothetical protein